MSGSIMRLSHSFLRTLREDPADAELPGHKLLVRAGYIRRVAPGVYTWLPLGLRVLRKVEGVVREEMDKISQELLFPALLPREPYEATNRWTEFADGLFRLKDRKGADMLLGPTHEEMFTLAAKDLFTSYKDLPLSIYQIQTKYRDEARPRAGVLRGREFVMKDSYSFDVTDEGLEASYHAHRDAYIKIFERLGFEYVIVKANAGAMGGSASEEFLVISPNGEDTFVRDESGYAANVEAVVFPQAAPVDASNTPAPSEVATPNAGSIDALVAMLNEVAPREDRPWQASDTLKNVVVMLEYPDGKREPLVIGLPGDRQVDEKRLEVAVAPAEVSEFSAADFEKYPQLVRGFIGPHVLGTTSESGIRYLLDPAVAEGSAWVTGANKIDVHVMNLVNGRDFTADGLIQAAEVRDGDASPTGHGALHTARGIEMGHIFQLGRKYAEALGLKVLDENGKLVTVTMGSYGVGVSRAVGALAEANLDDSGLCWPRNVAPADVYIVAAGKDQAIYDEATRIAEALQGQGVAVIYDDRPKVSPGVKFNDAELIGVPTILIIGKGLAEGTVELKDRKTGQRRSIAVADAVAETLAEIAQ